MKGKSKLMFTFLTTFMNPEFKLPKAPSNIQ